MVVLCIRVFTGQVLSSVEFILVMVLADWFLDNYVELVD